MQGPYGLPAAQPAVASVSVWGELRAERKLPGVLRVLVAGQHAGAIERKGGAWAAYWSAGMTRSGARRDRVTEHATVDEAVRAVVRSAWARRLGARTASRVYWTTRARWAGAR
jgi:hypothetical protein